MVRTYKRTYKHTRNGRNYKPYNNYTEQQLQTALQAVKEKILSLKSAAQTYEVPKTTLWRKLVGKNCTQKKAGRPTLFSAKEEKCFIQHIKVLAEWGFPFDLTDLRVFAQKYLDKLGKTIYGLKDNMPGPDWARYFLERYKKELSNRMASNISTERAKTTPEIIDAFFENYITTVEGVSPDCIINYDETNLTDDPGNKKYIYKRGTKYPERVINSSKTSISLMFAGTAAGQLLPIYVVYKADHLWDTWLEGGPEDTRYNRSKSGWFDGACFEDWFLKVIVPYAKSKPGRKVVVGDNLSSHFSTNVLNICQELNIAFVCLPPKTTHLLQPLDVAFYAPLKNYWRGILTQWKKIEGRKHKTLIKSSFPRLLAKLKFKLTEKDAGSDNLIAGFNKTGLYPVNAERPKSRLPRSQMDDDEETYHNTTSEVVTNMLQEMRGSVESSEAPKRKKRCEVPPGKSITAADLADPIISTKKGSKKNNSKKQVIKRLVDYPSSSSEENVMDSDITFVQSDLSDTEIPYDLPGPSGLANKKSTLITKETETKKNKRPLKRPQPSDKISKRPLVGKGKGIGKKSKAGKENLPGIANTKSLISNNITMRRKPRANVKKNKRATRKSSTSVSDCMSLHSDSDVIDVPENLFERDDYYEKFPFFTSAEMTKYTTNIYDDDSSIGDICDDLGIINSPCEMETVSIETNDHSNTNIPDQNKDVSFEEVKKSRITYHPSAILEAEHGDSIYYGGDDINRRNESEDRPEVEPSYSIGDYVLVRYYERKKWRYYIGTIESVKNEDDKYSIKFFKTIKKPELKFGITKKVDRDEVTQISIVKKLALTAKTANPKDLFLSDESDKVYFLE